MTATRIGEQALLLEEALRLNRFGMALEKAKLARRGLGSTIVSEAT
jgi:hypothetical protein